MMEAGKDYGVRVIRPFGQFSVGRIIFPFGTQRQNLLRGKMVEEVKPPVASVPEPKRKASREQ